jgi:hypothetical protein
MSTMLCIWYLWCPSFDGLASTVLPNPYLLWQYSKMFLSCHCLHMHRFCWFVYRHYPNSNSVLSLQMQCSPEECPLEGTEDCWVPPPMLQSFGTCKLGGHSFHPDASSFPYCQVPYTQISIKTVDFC